ncbi:hypothetical protein FBU59_004608 [Linderina macrospora]|uniref:Uncharacterized protein n=1 Tax=Linderina macrospora TaxID=4868 RepID=A0ACC1J590_9FUNG|nr:hypothetical protein FBU59_004608 [Linderina macrospora]
MGKSSKKEHRSSKHGSKKAVDDVVKKVKDKSLKKGKKDKSLKKEKDKKDKKDHKKSEKEDTPKTETPATSAGWNNWAAADFGDDARKQKFLKFMGIKKAEPTETATSQSSPFESALTKGGATKIQGELEKQFNAGLAMRQQTQKGFRGGLGF